MDIAALPFFLRPKKLDALSGEATAHLAKIADPAPGDEACAWRDAVRESPTYSDEVLSRALRRFDLDGYCVVKFEVFELALRAAGVLLDRRAAARFFDALDVARSKRCDAEVLVGLGARRPVSVGRSHLVDGKSSLREMRSLVCSGLSMLRRAHRYWRGLGPTHAGPTPAHTALGPVFGPSGAAWGEILWIESSR